VSELRDAEFREFVAARSRSLLRTAYLLTGDYQLAEDLVQTALTKTYLSWETASPTAASSSPTCARPW
jgi:DNA-directed RNA polymerase specialized sigma24 family protein